MTGLRHYIALHLIGPHIWDGVCACGYHIQISNGTPSVKILDYGDKEARHYGRGVDDSSLTETRDRAAINRLLADVNLDI